ncbi:hypothetical protein HYW60_02145 [Candidatus Kaiserbacteria bacterium]|nr:hypothetical protein [Candidatus Kaiserbacteria bacterium]
MSAGFMDSGEFIIAYSRPRPGLASIGIEAGTPLITGSIVGGWFAGKARRFKRYGSLTCTLEYAVSGMIAPGATIVLEGAAPIFARNRCASVGTTWDDEQARLTFYYVGSGQSPSVSFR